MPLVRDRALVLRRHPFGESSLIVHVLTLGHGRVHLIARGAFRPTSRFFAVLDLLDTLELEWQASPRRDLFELRSGSLLVRRSALGRELEHFRAAASVLELADLAAQPASTDEPLFALCERTLDLLESSARSARAALEPDVDDGERDEHAHVDIELEPAALAADVEHELAPDDDADARAADRTLVAFELDYLAQLGLFPSLVACAACGNEAPPLREDPSRAAFSAGAGGRLCAGCAIEARAAGRRVGTLPCEVLLDAHALGDARSAEIFWSQAPSRARIDRLRDFVERFLDYHLETRPRTHRAFLSVPNRNAPRSNAPASVGEPRPT